MPKRIYSQTEIEAAFKIGLPVLINKATQLQRRFCGDRVNTLVRFDNGDSFRVARQVEEESKQPTIEEAFTWAIEDAEMEGNNDIVEALQTLQETQEAD